MASILDYGEAHSWVKWRRCVRGYVIYRLLNIEWLTGECK